MSRYGWVHWTQESGYDVFCRELPDHNVVWQFRPITYSIQPPAAWDPSGYPDLQACLEAIHEEVNDNG